MGVFQARQEDPSEWGGLPAEPYDSAAPEIGVEPAFATGIGVAAVGLGSISIPMPTEDATDATSQHDEPESD